MDSLRETEINPRLRAAAELLRYAAEDRCPFEEALRGTLRLVRTCEKMLAKQTKSDANVTANGTS